jgi:hypothetical protein
MAPSSVRPSRNWLPVSAAVATPAPHRCNRECPVDCRCTKLGTYNVQVQFANGDAVPQTGVCTIQVTVASSQPGNVRIHDIQGSRHISPLNGQAVSGVPGVVTALRTNGFYLQDPNPDANDATSEAVFVFTGATVIVLSWFGVIGMSGSAGVPSRGAASANLTSTEIATPMVTILSHGNALPAPVIIGNGGHSPSQVIDSATAATSSRPHAASMRPMTASTFQTSEGSCASR